jgi:NADH dehydrogenase/NADH:ubiquinone oxidoreductase subunit G
MGALTLKSFPFELRGWDIEKFESFDPTDSFGSNTRVYVSKDQIVLIEPEYDVNTFNTWLTDKGRQFFDGIFNSKFEKSKNHKAYFWSNVIKTITETVFMIDHCNNQQYTKKFVTIIFENLSLEVLSILNILAQNYTFIKLKRVENFKVNNDSEWLLQLNVTANKAKLNYSTLCLLVASNPRYEGYYLNLNLRQRFLKGNFKCLNIGSLLDLTFPVSFLGSNINLIKSITEGNNLICQDFKSAKNPLIIYNNELLKRNDGNNIIEMLKVLNYSSVFNKTWNGLNMLSSSLSESGNHLLSKYSSLSLNDLNNSSLLYFINVASSDNANLKVITELNLLKYSTRATEKKLSKNLLIDQNYKTQNNYNFYKKMEIGQDSNNYIHVPTNVFYENEETFMSTEGFFKRTTKLISRKKTRDNLQIFKKLIKHFKFNIIFLKRKNSSLIFFNSKQNVNFKNYTNFHYFATRSLTNLGYCLTIKTTPVYFKISERSSFKHAIKKIQVTKLKYWLDDFFTNGKDEYSQNSKILMNCSKILRTESTNFF